MNQFVQQGGKDSQQNDDSRNDQKKPIFATQQNGPASNGFPPDGMAVQGGDQVGGDDGDAKTHLAAEQAGKIAESYKSLEGTDLVNSLFEHILCRAPSTKERDECVEFLAAFRNSMESKRQLALVLLNHNDFVTIR